MSMWLIALAYLVGAVPFAFLLARYVGGTDVRYSGSGNLGAANVLRTTGPGAALAVLVLDIGKGYAVVFLAEGQGADAMIQGAVGVAVVAGHIFPVWLKFRGGKGVATACGTFTALAPTATLIAFLTFAAVVWGTRYISLGSMVATLVLPPLVYVTGGRGAIVLSAVGVASLVLVRHRTNMRRLSTGRERRLGERV